MLHSLASTARLPTRLNRVRKADRPHLHDLFGSLFLRTPPAAVRFLVLVQADFIAKTMMLSDIDAHRTSQTVVFAFFVVESG
jgi:hypothetical protein